MRRRDGWIPPLYAPSTLSTWRLGWLWATTWTPSSRTPIAAPRARPARSNTAIARTLLVSNASVEKYVTNIFAKLGLPPSGADHRRVLAVLRYLES